jgi:hypothetical protein
MRIAAMIAACALAACGPSTQSSDDVPDPNEHALPYGVIYSVGDIWALTADPGLRQVSFMTDEGAEASGEWTPPQWTGDRYLLSAGDIRAEFTEQSCEANGVPFPMRATITTGGETYSGCAVMRWDYQLIALMPQIDACIAQSPQTRWVSYAGQVGDDILVRLHGNDQWADCRVGANGASISPRSEELRVASDNAAIFVRGPGDNPGGECYEAPEVRGANNELLGWMMDPMGC